MEAEPAESPEVLSPPYVRKLEFSPLIHQVAGHKAEYELLLSPGGTILKPLQNHDRGETEVWFYTSVYDTDVDNASLLRRLRCFIPEFHGTTTIHGGVRYLELEDLTSGYKQPCVVDVKIGALLYAPEKMAANPAIIEKKFPLAKHIGYQILGMKVWCPYTKQYIIFEKMYFRNDITLDNVVSDGIWLFFQCRPDSQWRPIARAILLSLRRLERWFVEQRLYVFYGSSLLIMYEGMSHVGANHQHVCASQGSSRENMKSDESNTNDHLVAVHGNGDVATFNNASDDSDQGEKGNEEVKTDVRMIDFTHVFRSDQIDENYLFGLRILISHIESLLLSYS